MILSSLPWVNQETGLTQYKCQQLQKAKTTAQWVRWQKHRAQYLFTACQCLAWMGCCISIAIMNYSLDINRTGLCCDQVIWVDRKRGGKQQWSNPKWKGRNDNQLLQWLQSVMSWLASVHHYCFLVSGIRSTAMCQGLHTVSCYQRDWFNTSVNGTSFGKGKIPLLAARQPQHKTEWYQWPNSQCG